jgi:hypothetical protein
VGALTTRARLLANLMATSPLKDRIARAAGVDRRTFVADSPSLGPSQKPADVDVAEAGPRTNRMTVYYNETLPIITANAQATTEDVAARISSAAVKQLGLYLRSVAAQDRVPDARRLVVDRLGPARHGTVRRGSSGLVAAIAALVALGLWCGGIVLTTDLARRWRHIAAEEERTEWAVTPRPLAPSPEPAPPPSPADPDSVVAAPVKATDLGFVELPERAERPVRNPVV